MEGGQLWVSAAKSSPYLAHGGSQWVVKDTCQDKGPAFTCSSKAHWMVSYSGVRSSQRTPKNRSLCLWNPDDSGCIPRGKKSFFSLWKEILEVHTNREHRFWGQMLSFVNIPGFFLRNLLFSTCHLSIVTNSLSWWAAFTIQGPYLSCLP